MDFSDHLMPDNQSWLDSPTDRVTGFLHYMEKPFARRHLTVSCQA